MSAAADACTERQNLLIRLLDAVKQCQVRFGGRRELATEGDSRVSCLCAAWEAALSHGMKHTNKALSTLKQMTEMTGLSKVASNIGLIENIQNMETEPVFWQYVKEHLSKHEAQRYLLLRHVTTDAGRGRAWLRSTLNEHSLEKYMHMVLEDGQMMKTFYDDCAFLRDQERASMLPMMAAGLSSILFAINIDNPDLNAIRPAAGLDAILSSTPPTRAFPPRMEEEPRPVIHSELSPKNERRKERKKKKKIAHIVSFDDDDGTSSYCSTSPGSSVTSPLIKSFGLDLSALPTVIADGSPVRAIHGFTQHASIAENSVDMENVSLPSRTVGPVTSSPFSVTNNVAPMTSPPLPVTKDIAVMTSSPVSVTNNVASVTSSPLPITKNVVPLESSPVSVMNNVAALESPPVSVTNNVAPMANAMTPTTNTMVSVANTVEAVPNSTASAVVETLAVSTVVASTYQNGVAPQMSDTSAPLVTGTTTMDTLEASIRVTSLPAVIPNSKAALSELRCPSLMNGSVGEIILEDEVVNDFNSDSIGVNQGGNSTDTAPVLMTAQLGSNSISNDIGYSAAVRLGEDAGFMMESDTTNGKVGVGVEVLLDWNHPKDEMSHPNALCDNTIGTTSIESRDASNILTKRMDSISEGYANLVLGTLDHRDKQQYKAPSREEPAGPNEAVTVDITQPDTWSRASDVVAKPETNTSYQSSPNRSPQRGQPGKSAHQQASSPRPESIKGLDISERYKLSRCDSSDSIPGSISDSARTADSLRQKFGHWDSTDSADVRSITSNSSVGETGPSPTLPQPFPILFGGHACEAASLTPVTPDGHPLEGEFMMPLPATTASSEDSRSYDSIEVPSYTEDTENAAYALAVTQQGFLASTDLQKLGARSPEAMSSESLTAGELKQALVAMMLQKDETEALRVALDSALDVEREVNTALRAEVDGLKQGAAQLEERDAEKIKALSKENELLKHQLRKYVNAVQLLRTQGAKTEEIPGIHLEDVQPTIPAPRPHIDYSHEASEYEKKLIQVAEMHGELMEFNEVLHRHINVKDHTIMRLKQELTDLRGPLPEDFQMSDDSVSVTSEVDLAAFNRPLVNIWIPSAFLRGAGSDAFHVYQVYVRIRDEEWNIYRRYAEFHELHSKLRKKYPIVQTYEFPSKKTFGNRDPKFVEERRRKLQMYLRQVINLFLQTNPDFVANVSRTRLLQVAPFFGDTPNAEKKNKSKRKASRGGPGGRSAAPNSSPVPQQHYMGL